MGVATRVLARGAARERSKESRGSHFGRALAMPSC